MTDSIHIRRAGNLIEITGPEVYIDELSPQLKYNKRVPTKGWERAKSKFKYIPTVLFKSIAPGQIVTPSGFTRRAVNTAKQLNVPYRIEDLRKLQLPQPDFNRLGNIEFRDKQDEILLTLCSNDHGIIQAPTGFGKSEVVVWLAQVYPEATIVICAQQTGVVKTLFERLDRVRRDVGIVGCGYNSPNTVTVSTARSLKKAPLQSCEIFLYDECHTAAADDTRMTLAAIKDARKFGFSASPFGRHDQADLETEAIFGPVIYNVEYQAAVRSGAVADIEVLMLSVPGNPLPYDDPVAKERWGFWRNKTRNELIAQVAKQLPEDEQSLIIVSKVEHALNLKKLLPNWDVVYGSINKEQETYFRSHGLLKEDSKLLTDKDKDELRHKFEAGEIKKAIATGIWNTGIDFKQLVWLIRADGGAGDIGNTQIPGRLSRVQNKSVGYLIDFRDSFDPGLSSRSDRRLKSYKKKGWKIHQATVTGLGAYIK